MVRAPNFSRCADGMYKSKQSLRPIHIHTTAMYKWHSQLVSRSSRPLARDAQIVSEGIAASLRAFSISASRAEGQSISAFSKFISIF